MYRSNIHSQVFLKRNNVFITVAYIIYEFFAFLLPHFNSSTITASSLVIYPASFLHDIYSAIIFRVLYHIAFLATVPFHYRVYAY